MIFRPYYHFETGCAGYVFGCGTLGTCAAVDIRPEDIEPTDMRQILAFNRGHVTEPAR